MSGWDQYGDIENLETRLRMREGRETLDAECEMEVNNIRRMFAAARKRLRLPESGGDEGTHDS